MTVSFICLLNQLIGFGVLHSLCFKLLFKDYQSWNKSNFIYMYVRTPKAEFILVLRKKKLITVHCCCWHLKAAWWLR